MNASRRQLIIISYWRNNNLISHRHTVHYTKQRYVHSTIVIYTQTHVLHVPPSPARIILYKALEKHRARNKTRLSTIYADPFYLHDPLVYTRMHTKSGMKNTRGIHILKLIKLKQRVRSGRRRVQFRDCKLFLKISRNKVVQSRVRSGSNSLQTRHHVNICILPRDTSTLPSDVSHAAICAASSRKEFRTCLDTSTCSTKRKVGFLSRTRFVKHAHCYPKRGGRRRQQVGPPFCTIWII